jgi:exonuclease III
MPLFRLKLFWNFYNLIFMILLRNCVYPNSGPNIQSSNSPHVTFLQLNCNGVKNSLAEINSFLHEHKVKVACLQETKLSSKSKDPSFPGYHLLHRDHPGGGGRGVGVSGGGLITLVQHSVPFVEYDTAFISTTDQTIEVQAVTATIDDLAINVYNIYIPPSSSCPRGYDPDLQPYR